jgi:hypothetical protein
VDGRPDRCPAPHPAQVARHVKLRRGLTGLTVIGSAAAYTAPGRRQDRLPLLPRCRQPACSRARSAASATERRQAGTPSHRHRGGHALPRAVRVGEGGPHRQRDPRRAHTIARAMQRCHGSRPRHSHRGARSRGTTCAANP